jgi:hypothetical protein
LTLCNLTDAASFNGMWDTAPPLSLDPVRKVQVEACARGLSGHIFSFDNWVLEPIGPEPTERWGDSRKKREPLLEAATPAIPHTPGLSGRCGGRGVDRIALNIARHFSRCSSWCTTRSGYPLVGIRSGAFQG